MTEERFLRIRQVQERTGLPASSIYALMKAGDFPKSNPITPRRSAWRESDISEWMEQRIAAWVAKPAARGRKAVV